MKFRIIALAVSTGFTAALGAAIVVLNVTQTELQSQVLAGDRLDRERTAGLLASKLETLKASLVAVARQMRPEVRPQLWGDREAMAAFLQDKPLDALFDSVLAAAPDGAMLARIERGQRAVELPNIADRAYFKRTLQSHQPVVSEPLLGKVSKQALVVVAVSVLDREGRAIGVLAGSLRLQSNSLFADPGVSRSDEVRDFVIDRDGALLSHTDRTRILGRAEDEPGFHAAFAQWHDSGGPINTSAVAGLSEDHLVSMAGIPSSDWMLVRLTPRATALAPLATAQRTAWIAALMAGLLSALLAGAVAWTAVRPIGQLRDRAERMLSGHDASAENWPRQTGEIGAVSQAFQLLLQMRDNQRSEMQALLFQMQAVLDNADVGLTLTRNGRFEMVSRQFCATFGHEPEQLVGQSTRMIHSSDAAYDAFSKVAQPAFMQHGLFDGEVELMRRNGQPFWARMRGRAVVPGDRSRGTIWVVADVTQDKDHRDQLSWAASHDQLTGLLNRAAFEALLEQATEAAAKAPFCALFIDLDRFKHVNDTGGHAAGDALLRDIARELSARLRKTDSVARLGGDEFAVLLPQCPIPRAQALAEGLRAAVEAYRLDWEGQQFGVGASIGMVTANGTHASAAEVLRAADAACYTAKRSGRNQVAIADA